jgi:hypothetical protein
MGENLLWLLLLGAIGVVAWIIHCARLAAEERGAIEFMIARQEEWDRAQRRLALSCRKCGRLAVPTPDTGNRYRCEYCGNQFAAARHGQLERPGGPP